MASTRAFIVDFANRSFRDLADQDYITARIAYRREFDQQFRWCSLQALEKYFKAILIYNETPAKGLSHDLRKALDRVKGIRELEFSIPGVAEEFTNYISDYGPDRYLSHSTHLRAGSLLELDHAVWHVRRFCRTIGAPGDCDVDVVKWREGIKSTIKSREYESNPHMYRISGGFLEKVISKRLPAYDDLVWKNFYYGRRRKRYLDSFKNRMTSQNPTHVLYEEAFEKLASLVDFPKAVRNYYKKS